MSSGVVNAQFAQVMGNFADSLLIQPPVGNAKEKEQHFQVQHFDSVTHQSQPN
jgi:hypothetical protein